MFRRLTLNSHDDVAPTVVALTKRASVSPDVGPLMVSYCNNMQLTLLTGLQAPKVCRQLQSAGDRPIPVAHRQQHVYFYPHHALHVPSGNRNRASIQDKERLQMDRVISILIVVRCDWSYSNPAGAFPDDISSIGRRLASCLLVLGRLSAVSPSSTARSVGS